MYGGGTGFSIRYSTREGAPGTIDLLANRPLIVGAGAEADLRFSPAAAAPQHLQVIYDNGRVHIIDVGGRGDVLLNGRPVAGNQMRDWLIGDVISINNGSITLELVGAAALSYMGAVPPVLSVMQPAAPQPSVRPPENLKLKAQRSSVVPKETIQLTIDYQGSQPRSVTIEGHTFTRGVEILINPDEITVAPNQPGNVEAQLLTTRPLFGGGRFTVRFMAQTAEGLFSSTEVTLRVRPRYEILLLIVPAVLLCVFLTVVSVAAVVERLTPTITPTFTPLPTATIDPALIPTPVCALRCEELGWEYYYVHYGDNLSSLAWQTGTTVEEIVAVNCLEFPDLNVIPIGLRICLPALLDP